MFCERCKKRESTVHLTEIIKSVRSEVHLCEQCARDIGFNSKLSNYSLSIPDMLSFLDDGHEIQNAGICSCCGTTARDISDNGRVGCPECYRVHADFLKLEFPEIGSCYSGKHPLPHRQKMDNTGKTAPMDNDIKNEDLSVLLEAAIRDERYEEAAQLRDLIKAKAGR